MVKSRLGGQTSDCPNLPLPDRRLKRLAARTRADVATVEVEASYGRHQHTSHVAAPHRLALGSAYGRFNPSPRDGDSPGDCRSPDPNLVADGTRPRGG